MGASHLVRVATHFGAGGAECSDSHGTLQVLVHPTQVADAARALKEDFGFDLLLDVTAVDWPERDLRFDVVWHFYTSKHFVRVRLKTRVPAQAPSVTSLVSLYSSARYAERECHDMYGICFDGNDDLRPILLYEGFVGNPLRKDYPKDREQPLVPYRA